jgi:ATP-dependent Clp protease ATP-binding subunit ClpX
VIIAAESPPGNGEILPEGRRHRRFCYIEGFPAAPDAAMKPREIKAFLDRYVIGQDDAKKTLAVAVYTHRHKLALAGSGPNKSNVLLIGPTGTGKTLLCQTLARCLATPFVSADATALSQARFVGDELEALIQRLLEQAGGDAERAGRGIVFIDEIDKLANPDAPERASAGRSVQHALLKIMEGSLIRLPGGVSVDTRGILFICGGAFVGLEAIIASHTSYGFIGTADSDDGRIIERLNSRIKPTDLFNFGLIPEFTGRLPVIARLAPLGREDFVRIMQVPEDSLYRQFQAIFRELGSELVIDPPVFAQIAELALEYKVGARSLRGIFEELLTPVLYDLPDAPAGSRVHFHSLFSPPDRTSGGQDG